MHRGREEGEEGGKENAGEGKEDVEKLPDEDERREPFYKRAFYELFPSLRHGELTLYVHVYMYTK